MKIKTIKINGVKTDVIVPRNIDIKSIPRRINTLKLELQGAVLNL